MQTQHNSLCLSYQNMPGESTVPTQTVLQWPPKCPAPTRAPPVKLESSHPFPLHALAKPAAGESPASTLLVPTPREAWETPNRDLPPLSPWEDSNPLVALDPPRPAQSRQWKPTAGALPGHGGGFKPCSEPGKEGFQAGPCCPSAFTHMQGGIWPGVSVAASPPS